MFGTNPFGRIQRPTEIQRFNQSNSIFRNNSVSNQNQTETNRMNGENPFCRQRSESKIFIILF
ncbi:MAG: hypothetical protein MJ252_20220 [archaeon]|nr:hypothetical protein [archaeon]